MLRDVIEWTRDLYHVDVERQDDGSVDVRAYAAPGAPRLVTQPMKARIDGARGREPDGDVPVPPARARSHVAARPGHRRARLRLAPGRSPQPLDVPPVEVDDSVLSTPTLTNGLVSIEVDTATATFSLTDADGLRPAGLGRLVDDGDEGDTYNYSPPAFDSVVDWADSCTVMTIEHGPLRGALLMTARYHWPECIEDGERIRGRDVTVETLIELRAGERFARITVELDNQCRDHRLRAWFPLPIAGDELGRRVRVRRRRARARSPRAGRPRSACRRSRRVGSSPRAVSRSRTRASSSTSSSTSTKAVRGLSQ